MGQLPLSKIHSYTLPWCSDEYLYSLQQRFEEFSDYSRQDLFKVLYENVDRESPEYENNMDVIFEAYELVSWNIIDDNIEIEQIYQTDTVVLNAKYPDLLYYLFEALPEPNIVRLWAAIDSTIENIWSSYLVLWSLWDSVHLSLVDFSRSVDIEEVSFATLEWFQKHGAMISNASPLLALSIRVDDEKTPGVAILDTHIIRRSLTQDGTAYVFHKHVSFDEFVELFNQADLAI